MSDTSLPEMSESLGPIGLASPGYDAKEERRMRLQDEARNLFQWPQRVASAIVEADAVCRLHSHLLGKIVVSSDYSGYGSEIEALQCSFRAFVQKHSWHFAEPPFVFKRACDIGTGPQKVLSSLSKSHMGSKMCVFSDVVEHCHPRAVEYLRSAVPLPDASPEDAERAYAEMLEWLLKNRAWALPGDQVQKCLVHSGMCYVSPMASYMLNARSVLSKKRKVAQAMLDASDPSSASASSDRPSDQQLARVLSPSNDEGCLDFARPGMDRPLSISFAGVTCDGWSSMGSQKRFAHESELAHNVFVAERLARSEQGLEDIAFVECTQHYPAHQKLQEPLQGSHRVLSMRISPIDLGYPVSRSRMFAVCLNTQTVAWLGPQDWEADFKAKFFRSCDASGSALFAAPDEERIAEYKGMAAQQKNYMSREALRGLSDADLLAATLSPGQLQRAEKYLGARTQHENPAGEYLFDVDHHLEARRMAGQNWPCMLTHGCIISAPRHGRLQIATAAEHFGAQGLHLFNATTQDNCESPLRSILRGFKPSQLKTLSGRGVHLAVLSAWIYYCLSNILPIWRTSPSVLSNRSLSWETVDHDESDDEG